MIPHRRLPRANSSCSTTDQSDRLNETATCAVEAECGRVLSCPAIASLPFTVSLPTPGPARRDVLTPVCVSQLCRAEPLSALVCPLSTNSQQR